MALPASERPGAGTFREIGLRVAGFWRSLGFLRLDRRVAPFRIGINHGGRKGLILLDQVRAVDKTRLAKKLGVVSAKTLTATLRTLQEVFAE